MLVHQALGWCAAKGRYLLIAGLVMALALPGLAQVMKPHIPEMLMGMLFLAAFRVGLRAAIGVARDLRFSLLLVLIFQIAIPVLLFSMFQIVGWKGVLPAAIVLMAAGTAISGAPNLAVLCGADPAPALRLMVIGTALLPFTVLPVFWLLPQLGSGYDILLPAAKLMAVIGVSAGLGFAIRRWFFTNAPQHVIRSADGASALLMMIIVVGLMSAVGPAWKNAPADLIANLVAAICANFGLQLICYFVLKSDHFSAVRVPISIVCGNRNIALFLTALPLSVTEPMLLFIGCYQIPMYLTPLMLGRLYRRSKRVA